MEKIKKIFRELPELWISVWGTASIAVMAIVTAICMAAAH